MKMKIKTFVFLIFILNFSSLFSHRCGTDLLLKKLNSKQNTISNRVIRRKLSNEYSPLQIKIDYSILDLQKSLKQITEDSYNKFKTELDKMPNYFKKIISVQHEVFDKNNILSGIKNNCLSPIYNLDDIDSYDLIVYPEVDADGQFLGKNAIAAAAHCLLSQTTQRPIVGTIILNKELNTKSDIGYYIRNTIFHEFFHILGFNTIFFNQIVYDNNFAYLNSPKLLEKAKIHFGCDNIKGIRLEDQGETGTIGSHWDARYLQGELMIGEDYTEVVLSDMTLAFLEDLGYYQVNYFTGGLFRFGKNQGCAFLNKKCVYNEGTLFSNEFCVKPSEPFCTGSLTSKGNCYIVQYKSNLPEDYQYFTNPKIGSKVLTNYCPISFYSKTDDNYNYPMNCIYGKKENKNEVIGSNSMCFISSLNLNEKTSICYQMECDRNNKKIKVNIGEKTIICDGTKKEMNNPEGLKGYLLCPDYNMICTSETWCNNMFDCIEKESIADENTYEYNSNKDELKERDIFNLAVDDSSKYTISNYNSDNSKGFIFLKFINLFIILILYFI